MRRIPGLSSGFVLEPSSELAHLPLGTSIPATQDPKGVLSKLFGVTEIPTAFAIDKRGRVIAFAASNSVLSLRQLRALVNAACAASRSACTNSFGRSSRRPDLWHAPNPAGEVFTLFTPGRACAHHRDHRTLGAAIGCTSGLSIEG